MYTSFLYLGHNLGIIQRRSTMKKLIAILIISTIAFTAFAIDLENQTSGVGNTQLNLSSTVAGKLYHGFSSTAQTKGGMIDGIGSESLDVEVELDGTDDAQSIGFYSLYTNGTDQVKVDLTISPLELTVESTKYYIPYSLSLGVPTGSDDGIDYEESFSLGTASVVQKVANTVTAPTDTGTLLTTSNSGLRWTSVELKASFEGSDNKAEVLAQGDYTGTIIAAVTTNN